MSQSVQAAAHHEKTPVSVRKQGSANQEMATNAENAPKRPHALGLAVRILIEPILFREGLQRLRTKGRFPGFRVSRLPPLPIPCGTVGLRGCPRFTVAGPRRIRTGFPFNPGRAAKADAAVAPFGDGFDCQGQISQLGLYRKIREIENPSGAHEFHAAACSGCFRHPMHVESPA